MLSFGCKRQQAEMVSFGYRYLPLNIGASIDYAVDSTVYNDFTQSDTTYTFTIRETVADTFTDATGRLNYRIERLKRLTDTGSFQIQKSIAVVVEGSRAERLEDNQRTVILSFPIEQGKTWDGNAFSDQGMVRFEIESAHKSESIGTLSFDSVTTVIHYNDTSNFIEKRFRKEQFARDVGLVSLEYIHIETKLNGDSGLHLVQRIIN